jgi:hypothetical protein
MFTLSRSKLARPALISTSIVLLDYGTKPSHDDGGVGADLPHRLHLLVLLCVVLLAVAHLHVFKAGRAPSPCLNHRPPLALIGEALDGALVSVAPRRKSEDLHSSIEFPGLKTMKYGAYFASHSFISYERTNFGNSVILRLLFRCVQLRARLHACSGNT